MVCAISDCKPLGECVSSARQALGQINQIIAAFVKHCIAGGLVLFVCSSVFGQDVACDQLRPLRGTFEYKNRGNRCEGLYVANVGAKELRVVSLTQGRINYVLKGGIILQVSVPPGTGRVHVRAISKIPTTYYQMDALLPAGSTLAWPVSDVLLPQGLDADRIGVFAWKGDNNDVTLLPVRVGTPGSQPLRSERIYLTVRPTFDVEKVQWRAAQTSGEHCSPFGKWRHAARDQALGGQPVDISLDGLNGKVCIEVAAQAETANDWSTLSLQLELPSQ